MQFTHKKKDDEIRLRKFKNYSLRCTSIACTKLNIFIQWSSFLSFNFIFIAFIAVTSKFNLRLGKICVKVYLSLGLCCVLVMRQNRLIDGKLKSKNTALLLYTICIPTNKKLLPPVCCFSFHSCANFARQHVNKSESNSSPLTPLNFTNHKQFYIHYPIQPISLLPGALSSKPSRFHHKNSNY